MASRASRSTAAERDAFYLALLSVRINLISVICSKFASFASFAVNGGQQTLYAAECLRKALGDWPKRRLNARTKLE